MNNLILIGAGAWGLEVWSWLENAIGYGSEFNFKGFLDTNLDAMDNKKYCNAKVIGSEDEYEIQKNDRFVITLGCVDVKKKIALKYQERGAKFINLIHSNSIFFKGITLGKGIVISPNCVVSNNSKIDHHVSVNLFSTIGHDTSIGSCSVISGHCDITGNVKLGENVFLGSRVSIVPKKKICDDVSIAAGSTVFKNIREPGSYLGNPAKKLPKI